MDNNQKHKLISFKQVFILLISSLMYFVGTGIAHYLGSNFKPVEFWLGLVWVITINISGYLLLLYFSPRSDNSLDNEKIFLKFKKPMIMQLWILFLFLSCSILIIFVLNNIASLFIILLFILVILGQVGLAVPPLSLAAKGFQEIALSIFQGCLVPAIGFFLLVDNFHRLLFLIAFPMTFHALAVFLAWNFSSFAHDVKVARISLVRLLTWQIAIPIHQILLFGAYLFFVLGYWRGLPVELLRIALLTIPFAGFLIFWVQKIKRGGKPLWPFFNVLSASIYGLSAYLIALTLWTI